MTSKTTNKFPPEVRSCAVRMALDHEDEHPSRWATPQGLWGRADLQGVANRLVNLPCSSLATERSGQTLDPGERDAAFSLEIQRVFDENSQVSDLHKGWRQMLREGHQLAAPRRA